MKKNFFIRLVILSVMLLCGLLYFQNGINRQSAEDQCTDDISTAGKKRASGEFIILESISRYLTASYH
jgi:hypothetical protein